MPEWICQLTEHGLVRASFVPPAEIREIRELTRYRRTVVEERSSEAQRLDKVLQDAGIKLSSVASDILGVSGRAMLVALVSGTDDPEVLADLAKGLLRKKIPRLRSALVGTFRSGSCRARSPRSWPISTTTTRPSAGLSEAIDERMAPFADARDRLCTIPGVDRRIAEAIIGEIGVDMTRFATPGHWPRGRACAPDNTSRPARPRRAPPARATAGSSATSPSPPWQLRGPRAPIWPPSTPPRRGDEARCAPAKQSATPSSSRSGTSSRIPRRPSSTSDPTGSTAATRRLCGHAANSLSCGAWAALSLPTAREYHRGAAGCLTPTLISP